MGMNMQGARHSDGPVNQSQPTQNAESRIAQDCAKAEDVRRSSGQPGSTTADGASGEHRTYASDLFEVTKAASTMEGHLQHPDMTGATAADIHSRSHLFPRDEAANRNAARALDMHEFHKDRAIIGYATSLSTDNLGRAHGPGNQVSNWGAMSAELGRTPAEAGVKLSLILLPSLQSDVRLPVGAYVEASRPISDAVRQYYFFGKGHPEYFLNPRKLG